MVREAAIMIFIVLVCLALGQYFLLRIFVRALRGVADAAGGDGGPWPRVAVIMCLRGGDPFLADCLRAILDQDYPDYELFVVVDSRSDPAWSTVQAVVEQAGADHVHVTTLARPRETCSLKCSSLVQAVSQLDESYRVVALVDADTLAHRSWLRELVAPFSDPAVGAATGNRWYMPAGASIASLVRYLWNAAAVVQMCCFDIPWGGTLAIRREVFERSDLLERWGRAFCEDTMMYGVLRKLGLRVAFVPSLTMVNREDCSLSGYVQWLRRQLLAARLYHPLWAFTVVHALSTFLIWAGALGLGVGAALVGDPVTAAWGIGAAAVYIALMFVYLPIIEAAVRHVVRRRGESTRWMNWRTVLAFPVAGVLLQVVYPLVLLSTLGLRHTRWRGIDYLVRGPWSIRMVEYRPYGEDAAPERGHSL